MIKNQIIPALLLTLLGACTTPPIGGPDGVITDPNGNGTTVEDPGLENPCDPGEISFQHEVLPIILSACAYSGCHDAATAEDGVRLETYSQIKKEVKAGDPNDSELYESITESEWDEIMPPPPAAPLTNAQINIIREWILQGAKETNCGAPCDPNKTSFSADIYPLLQSYCVGCHNVNRADGNVQLDGYAKVKSYADNGVLLGVIKHEPSYFPMPPSGSKMSTCRVTQIENWISEGAQNN